MGLRSEERGIGWAPARREARVVAAAIDLFVVALIAALCGLAALGVMLAQVNPLEADPTLGQWVVGYAIAALAIPAGSAYIWLGTLQRRDARRARARSPRRGDAEVVAGPRAALVARIAGSAWSASGGPGSTRRVARWSTAPPAPGCWSACASHDATPDS